MIINVETMSINKMLSSYLLFLFGCLTISAQEKFEREYRVAQELVPMTATNHVKKYGFKNKIKWYAEESQDGKTFEAKTKHAGYLLSLEFDKDGNILDIEKRISLNEIPAQKKENVLSALSKRFSKYKIRKIQAQFLTKDGDLPTLIMKEDALKKAKRFEIVLKGTSNKEKGLFELLIDNDGTILKELRFVPRDRDNLEF